MEEASSTSSSALPDLRKLFVGGIPCSTTEQTLKSYFEKYGEVVNISIPFDRINERNRGFGFVHFNDPAVGQRVLEVKEHIIDGRKVEVKMATPQSKHQSPSQMQPWNQGHDQCYNINNCTNGHSCVGKKIFVGGLPSTLTEDKFRSYFEMFGQITDVVIIRDNITNRSRGFGFITYESEDSVKDVLRQSDHQHGRHLHLVGGKNVEVKIASPKGNNGHNQRSVVDRKVPIDYQVETIQYYPRYSGYMSPGVSIYPYGANYYGGHMNMSGFYSGYASPSATWNLPPFGGMRYYYTDVHIFQGGQIPIDGHTEVAQFDDDNSPDVAEI
ncbi:hypothetical protein J5N97_028480 [Dioscorea zingiberensis]|uniref:RRM domain-containing protein n=1 Tax=Dioscorea zingiberensis TaxID=325984 RepID=A0A9D5BZ03_9LILI|nr:hypothetical protein J5N97_028480 [Dioscorea zingiberensis]